MSDILECPVCLDTYVDPQLIGQCGHTFCRACVEALRPRRCPQCRSLFKASDVRPNFALRLVLQDLAGGAATTSSGSVALPLHARPSDSEHTISQARSGRNGDVCEEGGQERSIVRDTSHVVEDRAIQALMELGLPWGLARLVHEEDRQIALRLFLLDNSGSTNTVDGKVLMDDAMIPCTRWEEIQHMATQQAAWNARIGTPCEFVLLNPPAKRPKGAFSGGVDFVRIDPGQGDLATQQLGLQHMLRATVPKGPTPLAERLSELYGRIARDATELAAAGQRVVLVIATDGLPTGSYSGVSTEMDKARVAEQLRRITGDLPVHVVIRLTTDDDDVVAFYNNLDEELELPLEVLDDIESEAKEVAAQGNQWLTYSPVIHTLREGGTFVKLFDLLDERRLTNVEVLLLSRMLLQDESQAPLPRDPEDFVGYVETQLEKTEWVYDPLKRRMAPCINVYHLRRAVVPSRFCGCCRRRRRDNSRLGLPGMRRKYDKLREPAPGALADTTQNVIMGRPVGG